jgi:hypothetical protein
MKWLKIVFSAIVSLLAVVFLIGPLYAQSYPTKPIRMIVPFPAALPFAISATRDKQDDESQIL